MLNLLLNLNEREDLEEAHETGSLVVACSRSCFSRDRRLPSSARLRGGSDTLEEAISRKRERIVTAKSRANAKGNTCSASVLSREGRSLLRAPRTDRSHAYELKQSNTYVKRILPLFSLSFFLLQFLTYNYIWRLPIIFCILC